MTPRDPTSSVHYAMAEILESRWQGGIQRYWDSGGLVSDGVRGDDPDDRSFFLGMVVAAWVSLGFGFGCAAVAMGFVVSLVGARAGQVVAYALLAVAFFCIAGCLNALWHKYWHVPLARFWRYSKGADSKRFARAMRRAVPTNYSLIFQAGVGIFAFVILLKA